MSQKTKPRRTPVWRAIAAQERSDIVEGRYGLGDKLPTEAALAAIGIADYTRASTRLTAVLADATQALHLRLREGDPLLRATSVNVEQTGVPVEYGRTWYSGDHVTLTLDL